MSHLQDAKIECYVLRLAKNFTARRNFLPEHGKKGRKPRYGTLVRPLTSHAQEQNAYGQLTR